MILCDTIYMASENIWIYGYRVYTALSFHALSRYPPYGIPEMVFEETKQTW